MDNSLGIGETFDKKFEIKKFLGSGGVGSVYKAEDRSCGRTVALKILHAYVAVDEEWRTRFIREAQALAKIEHPNIVRVYGLGVDEAHVPYITMEYLDGESLRYILSNTGKLPVLRALQIIREAASALSFSHKQNIIHRDLKLENMLIVQVPEPDTVKLVDFGLAKLSDKDEQKLTSAGALIGTPDYMSPEQCKGLQVNFSSDIYSLTICLYELITGKTPFRSDSAVGMLYQHITEQPPSITARQVDRFHAKLNELLLKGLAKDPQQRFGSMDEMIEELDAVSEIIRGSNTSSEMSSLLPVATLVFGVLSFSIILFFFFGSNFNKHDSPTATTASPTVDSNKKAERVNAHKEQSYKIELNTAEKESGPESWEVVDKLSQLATLYLDSSKYEKAESLFRRCLHIAEKLTGANGQEVRQYVDKLAYCLEAEEKWKEAEELRKRAVAIAEASGNDPDQCCKKLGNLAEHYSRRGNLAEAEQCYKNALRLKEASDRAKHLKDDGQICRLYQCIGELELQQAKYSGAIKWYSESLKANRALLEANTKTDEEDLQKTLNELTTAQISATKTARALEVLYGVNSVDKSLVQKLHEEAKELAGAADAQTISRVQKKVTGSSSP